MDIMNFLLGVASSVTASVVAWLFVRYACPKLEAWRYGTDSIAGSWLIRDTVTEQQEGVLVIKQFGTRIIAHLHLERQGVDFDYSGVYLQQQLLLTFQRKGHKPWIIGSFLLRLLTDGTMVGRTLFWHHDKAEFHCNQYAAQRV